MPQLVFKQQMQCTQWACARRFDEWYGRRVYQYNYWNVAMPKRWKKNQKISICMYAPSFLYNLHMQEDAWLCMQIYAPVHNMNIARLSIVCLNWFRHLMGPFLFGAKDMVVILHLSYKVLTLKWKGYSNLTWWLNVCLFVNQITWCTLKFIHVCEW